MFVTRMYRPLWPPPPPRGIRSTLAHIPRKLDFPLGIPASLQGVEFYRRWLPIGKLKCVCKDARASMKAREAVWLARGPQTMSAFSSSWPLVTLTERWQPCELGSPQRREAGRGCGEDRNRQEERSEQQRSNDRAMTIINSILRTAV